MQGPAVDVMKKKRAIHEKVINLVQQQRSSDHVAKVDISVEYVMHIKTFKFASKKA